MINRPAGSFIQTENGLEPNMDDEAMKARAGKEEPVKDKGGKKNTAQG